jgi:iron complex outermembrane receptor protein
LHFSVRGLDDRTQFGGSDEIDFGPARLGEKFEPAEPKFRFGELSLDRVRQTTVGLAYDGRWKDVGEVGLSISRAYFRKATALPQQPVTSSDSRPWLYDGTIAATPVRAVMIYAGFARGLEESGLAPPNARNRNEPLPTILTQQEDAGFRLTLTSNLRLVGGVFNLKRPYFGFDRNNNYLQVGVTDSRGAEVSLTGSVTPRLTILIGGVFLNARVVPSNAASGDLGRRPTGVPDHTLSANLDWRIPFVSGLELDLAAYERGAVPSTSDNVVILRRWRAFDVGTHYRFKVANHPTTLRLQLKNMFNRRGLSYQGPGVDGINPGRLLSGSLTVDL